MRTIQTGPKSNDRHPYKKRGRQRYLGRGPGKDRLELCCHKPRNVWSGQELEEAESLQRQYCLPTPWSQTSDFSRIGRESISVVFSGISLGNPRFQRIPYITDILQKCKGKSAEQKQSFPQTVLGPLDMNMQICKLGFIPFSIYKN